MGVVEMKKERKNLYEKINLSDGIYNLINEKETNKGSVLMYKKDVLQTLFQEKTFGKNPETIENINRAEDQLGEPKLSCAPSEIVLGFDTEYVSYDGWESFDDYLGLCKIESSREIVSYQFYTEINEVSYGFIIYPLKGDRVTVKELIGLVIDSLMDFYKVSNNLKVLLISHFGLVDLSATKNAKSNLLNKVSIHDKCVFNTRALKYNCYVRKNKKNVSLYIRDSMLLSSGHSSLKVLGEALGYEKLYAGDKINDVMKWKDEDPSGFIAYAINDALVCFKWVTTIYKSHMENGIENVPVTIGNDAARFAHEKIKEINHWNDEEFDLYFRGLERVTVKTGGKRTTKDKLSIDSAGVIHTIARKCYYGGRNECYTSGIFKGTTYDYDLKGAYIAALALLEDPDFSKYPCNLSGELNLRQIDPLAYGFGHVRFEFPKGTKMPCLPVRDSMRGLIFPLKGETNASNPEVYAALLMGARIWVLSDYKLLNSFKDKKSFAEVARIGTKEREEQKKGSAQELSIKERNNSWYGKLGQGLREKRSYDSRYRKMIEIGDSLISNEVLAAHTTSLVRALISLTMAEVINKGYMVHSVTTDGFISDIPYEELLSINAGILTEAFKNARMFLSGKEKIWEIKHSQEILINIKTRANVGLNSDKEKLGVFAAGSFAIPREVKYEFKESQRVYLAEKFLNRSDEEPVMSEFVKFPSVRQLMENTERDFVADAALSQVNYEFDFKRRPVNVRDEEVTINGKTYKHVTFNTEPWETFEDFVTFRTSQENRKRVVKTAKELENLMFEVECSKVGVRNQVSVERTKATQILRNIRSGKITIYRNADEIIEALNKFYNLKLDRKAWNDAGKIERQALLVSPSLLMDDIVAMKLI